MTENEISFGTDKDGEQPVEPGMIIQAKNLAIMITDAREDGKYAAIDMSDGKLHTTLNRDASCLNALEKIQGMTLEDTTLMKDAKINIKI